MANTAQTDQGAGAARGSVARAGKIVIIRHAEKPAKDGGPPFGVDANGQSNDDSLSPLGWQRAGALMVLFAPARGSLQDSALAVPRHFFACGEEKGRKRLRPVQTVTLLAERVGTTVDRRFQKGEEAELADYAMGLEGVVLICWEHKNLHLIANRIVGDRATVPQEWPDDRFDVVWVFELSEGAYRFRQVPQLLLPGDRPHVI
ncbi:MAG TPA: hypothetical protein VJ550_07000 [Geomonas sp.]|nr:hypothetical protein [Geomonas sp.]